MQGIRQRLDIPIYFQKSFRERESDNFISLPFHAFVVFEIVSLL